jgi:hypothetical protein
MNSGGSGHAVAVICIVGGAALAVCWGGIMRLPPIGRLAVILAGSMALLAAGASVIDLGVAGW